MPKKFAGENQKSAQAKARKTAARNEETEKKTKAAEDAQWVETDKLVLRKQAKKEEELKKAQEKLEKKKEAERLLEEESKNLKSAKPRTEKVTKHEINKNIEKLEEEKRIAALKAVKADDIEKIEENVNCLNIEGDARDIDEAIAVLSQSAEDGVDKHPEKRMKAAYQEFYDANLERLKAENPSLRLSQLKQMIFKEWQKSPNNPLNK